MKYIYIIFVGLLSSYTTINAQNLTHTELLGKPRDKGITVQAFFDDSVEACVQYGTVTGTYPNQTAWQSFSKGSPTEINITGLTANTKYFYRLCYRQPGTANTVNRPEFYFQTQRSPSSTFSFVVQADPHLDASSDAALYRLCLKNQLDDAPDFMIDLGDFLMTDKLRNAAKIVPKDTITYRCNLLRSYYETGCHSVPLFIALGNHEGEAGWNLNNTANNIAVWGTNDRKKYFLNPVPDNFYTGDTVDFNFVGKRAGYYSWEWGNSLFIVLDPYWNTSPKPDSLNGWGWTLGKVQYDWLRRTLENSKANFKFVFAHQIIGGDPEGRGGVEFADRYEWGGKSLDGTYAFDTKRKGWYKPIKDLLTENRATIFFHGHDHFFGKQDKECLIYQETPQPSLPNFANANMAADYGYFQGQILPNAGHIKVTCSPAGVQVDYIRAYLPKNETATRKNKDVSATYFIGTTNCYDSLHTGVPVLWNSNYADELVYPNPFVQETKIEFALNKPEKINLNIINEEGKIVRRLIAGSAVQAGKFQMVWDGKDGSGTNVPAGIYWYIIQGESNNLSKGKIVLVR